MAWTARPASKPAQGSDTPSVSDLMQRPALAGQLASQPGQVRVQCQTTSSNRVPDDWCLSITLLTSCPSAGRAAIPSRIRLSLTTARQSPSLQPLRLFQRFDPGSRFKARAVDRAGSRNFLKPARSAVAQQAEARAPLTSGGLPHKQVAFQAPQGASGVPLTRIRAQELTTAGTGPSQYPRTWNYGAARR